MCAFRLTAWCEWDWNRAMCLAVKRIIITVSSKSEWNVIKMTMWICGVMDDGRWTTTVTWLWYGNQHFFFLLSFFFLLTLPYSFMIFSTTNSELPSFHSAIYNKNCNLFLHLNVNCIATKNRTANIVTVNFTMEESEKLSKKKTASKTRSFSSLELETWFKCDITHKHTHNLFFFFNSFFKVDENRRPNHRTKENIERRRVKKIIKTSKL